jgi:plastocyanin
MFYSLIRNNMKTLISSKSRLLIGIVIFFAIFSISYSCKKTSDTPGTNEVLIQGMAFDPGTITVAANTTITWTNKDGVAHTVTSNTGLFDSGTINANGTYSHMFATVGTFPYHCTVHPSMTATVIVN